LVDLFNELKETNISLSELYARQAGIVQDCFSDFFQFYKDELEAIKPVY